MLGPERLYEFGPFRLDPRERRLTRDGAVVALSPKAFDTLVLLVEQSGHLLTKDALMRRIWPDAVVEEVNLAQHISAIRRALGDDASDARYIETVPKQGYRFVAPVSRPSDVMLGGGTAGPEAAVISPPSASSRFMERRVLTFVVVAVLVLAGLLAFQAWRARRGTDSEIVGRRAIDSVAVLPLRNLSNDSSQDYFADGMTDELITTLAKVRQLRVISSSSVQRYKSSDKRLPEIARELGVDAVVEGSVVRSGERVRITAQLIDARSDTHLWADSYDRDVRDVLTLQGEVAARIAAAVGITLTASEKGRLAAASVVDPAAHEAYLLGNVYWNRLTCAGFQKALEYYTQAVTLAPGFAGGHAALADTHYTLVDWTCSTERQDGFAKAKAAAQKSVALQPDLARAHAVLGEIAFASDWNWPEAEARLRRAIDLDRNDAGIHATYAIYLAAMGRQAAALGEVKQALALDPVSEGTKVMAIYVLYLAHRFDEAIAEARRTLELYPGSGAAYYWMAHAYEQNGMIDEAAAAYLRSPDGAVSPWLEGARRAHRRSGLPGFWRYQLQIILERTPPELCTSAPIYARLGQRDRALELLEQDFASHCEGLRFLAVEPVYDSLRDDPRFHALLSRMRLPSPDVSGAAVSDRAQ